MLVNIESLINCINEWIGRTVAWFILAMVIITFFNVVMRYGFNFGLIAIQESVIYFHSFVFMLAIAYTFKHNEHVRVDIFYSKYTEVQKAWVDLFGTLLLLFPFCIYLIFSSWEYAAKSWALLEGSREAGGLPILFVAWTSRARRPRPWARSFWAMPMWATATGLPSERGASRPASSSPPPPRSTSWSATARTPTTRKAPSAPSPKSQHQPEPQEVPITS